VHGNNVLRKGALKILRVNTVPVLTISEIKGAAGFAYVKSVATFAGKLINDILNSTVKRVREKIARVTIFVFTGCTGPTV